MFIRKTACPKCREEGRDKNGDNLALYTQGGAYCFSCGYTVQNDKSIEVDEEDIVTTTIKEFSEESKENIKRNTTTKGQGIRGLKDSTLNYFGVRHEVDEDGDVIAQYYPTTINGGLVGYKIRKLPKQFSAIGEVGNKCELFGQFRFKGVGKHCLIVAGEVDQLSAYQMLEAYRKTKADKIAPVAVVSPTVGESGCVKQIQAQYQWFDQFERIVVCFDNDEAGRKATDKVVKALPRGKVFLMELTKKDTNEYLEAGMEQEYIKAFYGAKKYTPAGIVASDDIYDEILKRAMVDKVSLPPFLEKLNDMLASGLPYGYIVNIIAGSGIGKSVFVNECVIHFIKTLNLPVGVVSLEADVGNYGENLLSRYMETKIAMFETKEEKLAFVGSEEANKAAHDLFTFEDGSPRLYILDDRGDFDNLQSKIEELIVSFGVKIILIDVISDVFAGFTIEQVDRWMAWEKNLVKQYNCILIQVAHARKSGTSEKGGSQGAFISEESLIGSGTQYRSAGVNISLQRDKNAEDEIERNTTRVHLLKSRDTGCTGPAGELYYDNRTHKLYDKEYYFSNVT